MIYMRLFVSAMLAVIASCLFSAAGQRSIDRLIESCERDSTVQTIYTERRDEQHRLYRVNVILNFNDPELYRRFETAFERERGRTRQATKQRDCYIYRFLDNDGRQSTYTLSRSGASFTVIKDWRHGVESSGDDESSLGETVIPDLAGVPATGTVNSGEM